MMANPESASGRAGNGVHFVAIRTARRSVRTLNGTTSAMTRDSDTRLALEKDAETLRMLIRHENDLTNHRTTWLLVSQGILFTAAAVFTRIHWVPALVVGTVGIILAVSIGQSLTNSYEARQFFKKTWWPQRLASTGYKVEDFPPLDGGVPGVRAINWLFPWFVIPRTLVVAWGILIAFFLWGASAV
jgi:hypothetical protein